MIGSDSEEDPWGEEPLWAASESQKNKQRKEGQSSSSSSLANNDDTTIIAAAQHILILIDCHPSMFVPSVCVQMDSTKTRTTKKQKQENQTNAKLVSPFDVALMSCEKLLRLRVHDVATSKANGKRDGVGILLYGVTKNSNSLDDKHQQEQQEEQSEDEEDECFMTSPTVHEFIPLVPPGTKHILEIRKCLPRGFDEENENNFGSQERERNLKEEFVNDETSNKSDDSGNTSHLRNALHESIKAFSNAKCVKKNTVSARYPMVDTKSLWIFTNQYDPCQGNDREQKQSLVLANDVAENGIEIHLWPLGNIFRTPIFYDKIDVLPKYHAFGIPTSPHDPQHTQNGHDDAFNLGDVLDEVQNNWKKIRKLQSLPFLFPDWKSRPQKPSIMLDLYPLIRLKRKPIPVIVNQKTNRITQRTTQMFAADTGEIIENKDRLRTFVEYGGKRVYLSKNDLAEIKKRGNSNPNFASLILYGFKPSNTSLPLHHILEKSIFAFPNEDMVSGSTKAFASLHASMIRKKVYGIGELLTRVTGTSRMVAIVPQEGQQNNHDPNEIQNPIDSSSSLLHPPGFLLITLPFQEDIRATPDENDFIADDVTADAAKELIQHQQLHGIEIGYSFENPSLHKFWHYVECVALGIKLKERVDETQMDVKTILESAKSQIEKFESFLPTTNDSEDEPI